jgi:hypothetical protein
MRMMTEKKQDGITKFQRKGMVVIYVTRIQNIDDYIGGFVFLKRLPSNDR